MSKFDGKMTIRYNDECFVLKYKGEEPSLAIFVQILIDNIIEQGYSKKEFLEKMKNSYEIQLKDRSDNNG